MAALLLLFCLTPSLLPVWTTGGLPQAFTPQAPIQIPGQTRTQPPLENTVQHSTQSSPPPILPQNFPSSGGQLAHYSTQDEDIAPYVENPLSSFTLPYAEGPAATLADKIRQADTALLQAVARLKQSMGLGDLAIRIQYAETRIRLKAGASTLLSEQVEAYPFLQAVLYLPAKTEIAQNSAKPTPASLSPALVRGVLEESLLLWAPDTTLTQEDSPFGPFFFLRTENTISHCVLLFERTFPIVPQNTPALALIIDDAGEDTALLRQVLALPYPLTVSVLPETAFAEKTALLAKAWGQEVFLHQPMEARPGYVSSAPHILTKEMETQAILPILWHNLARVPGANGLNNHTGSAFTSYAPSVQNFLDALSTISLLLQKSFLLVDSVTATNSLLATMGAEQGFAVYARTLFIDEDAQVQRILAELAKAEKMVDNGEYVLLIGHLRPTTVKALKQWVPRVPVVFIPSIPPLTPAKETP